MLFKISTETTTTFVSHFTFDAKNAKIIILDNEMSNMTISLDVSKINVQLLSRMFNVMTHQLMEDAIANNKGYTYINLRVFVENYEAALLDPNQNGQSKARKVYEL